MGDTFVKQQTLEPLKQTNKQAGSSKYHISEIISPQFKGVVFSLSQTLTEALAFFYSPFFKVMSFFWREFSEFYVLGLKAQSSTST